MTEVSCLKLDLQVMLAQALNQQDRSAAAQLRETLRCLSLFDQVKVPKNKHRVFNFTI